ncbi:unnamed protein product [Nezara viridula]|uniref:Uncharacterized protein n=2 Tax=Nezara viridula TaxID=85310 RepID=A0A9P0HQ66_NEZVI|nr:unnamed protein product [Nezara viridula]
MFCCIVKMKFFLLLVLYICLGVLIFVTANPTHKLNEEMKTLTMKRNDLILRGPIYRHCTHESCCPYSDSCCENDLKCCTVKGRSYKSYSCGPYS